MATVDLPGYQDRYTVQCAYTTPKKVFVCRCCFVCTPNARRANEARYRGIDETGQKAGRSEIYTYKKRKKSCEVDAVHSQAVKRCIYLHSCSSSGSTAEAALQRRTKQQRQQAPAASLAPAPNTSTSTSTSTRTEETHTSTHTRTSMGSRSPGSFLRRRTVSGATRMLRGSCEELRDAVGEGMHEQCMKEARRCMGCMGSMGSMRSKGGMRETHEKNYEEEDNKATRKEDTRVDDRVILSGQMLCILNITSFMPSLLSTHSRASHGHVAFSVLSILATLPPPFSNSASSVKGKRLIRHKSSQKYSPSLLVKDRRPSCVISVQPPFGLALLYTPLLLQSTSEGQAHNTQTQKKTRLTLFKATRPLYVPLLHTPSPLFPFQLPHTREKLEWPGIHTWLLTRRNNYAGEARRREKA
jgi:hypothetical protein